MNENEFNVGGKVYVEVCDNCDFGREVCKGCAGEKDKDICEKLPDSCSWKDVIFVEKQP